MKTICLTLLGLALIAPARACLWDNDTLAMEKALFPEAADVISGNFPRHSKEFYEWRKTQREAALAKDPKQTALYDDLAVAKHKLGDHRGAIETMQAKEKVSPGLYETYSNLGTFYIYTGELDEALQWIDKALAINPNAHFGREKYQKLLVEWLKAGKPQTRGEYFSDRSRPAGGFAQFIVERTKDKQWDERVRKAALAGLLGMMRFADFDNPLLLEAVGDVLSAGEFDGNGPHLAAHAYILASRKSTTDDEKQRLWKKMEQGPGFIIDEFKPRDAARELDAALANGTKLNAQVRADELAWIKAGKDAGAEFQKKYLLANN